MPTIEIVSMVVSSLVTYLTMAGESLAEELGKVAYAKVEEIYKTVKNKFSKASEEEEDKNPIQTMESFEQKPEEWVGPMKATLMDMMASDPEFTSRLQKLVKESQDEAEKVGAANNFETMVTGGYVENILNIGSVDGDINL